MPIYSIFNQSRGIINNDNKINICGYSRYFLLLNFHLPPSKYSVLSPMNMAQPSWDLPAQSKQ